MNITRIFTALALVTTVCLCHGLAIADTLQTIDGKTIKGTILEEGDRIIIQEEGGRMSTFFRDQITNIIKGDSTPVTIDPNQFADIKSDKVGSIQRLMEVNGTKASLERNIRRTIAEAPAPRREEITKLFDLNQLLSVLVPIYDRYFTEEEIVAMIAFYESPAGIKMLEVTPNLVQDVASTTVNYFKEKLTGTK